MNESLWSLYSNEKKYNCLDKDITTDVLVIGGGISGILAARKLKDNNINVVVLEKDKIGMGTTSKTTAFLTYQHETLYQDLPLNKRREYLRLNKEAFKEYEKLSKIYDFDFTYTTSCLFSKNYDVIKKEYDVLKELDEDVELINNIPYEDNSYGVLLKHQAVINPIKLINEISKGLEIYEDSEVLELHSNYVVLKNNIKIKFNKVIIATHYPLINKRNLLFMKLTQRRSYVASIKNKDINGTYCSLDNDGYYYRKYNEYLIVGGSDRDTGSKCIQDFINDVINKLKIKDDEIVYSWSGQDCITIDGIPYIGYCDAFNKNQILITGFNLWGFTWSMAASNIVLDIIKNNRICELTKPNRFFIKGRLFKNVKNAIINLVTFKKPRCTHLGCALVYNNKEKVWECPCHGSRYSEEGNVLEGPAKNNLK